MTMLKVDKENLEVSYNDELHKYWVKETDQSCVSVTTLIHEFANFDEAFWASFKALEALVDKESFKPVRTELVARKVFKKEYLDILGVSEKAFEESRKAILKEWEIKREVSCIRGSKFHEEQENLH